MDRFRVSLAVAILGTTAALFLSLPTIRFLFGPYVPSRIVQAPVDISKAFVPSGWMGDAAGIRDFVRIDFEATEKSSPEGVEQKTTKISYRPGPSGWAGVAWQYPPNNWGAQRGLTLSGAKALTFWAVGERGGEVLDFKVGGIRSNSFPDTVDRSLPNVILGKEWRKYRIELSGSDLSNVITGFAWLASRERNSNGVIFYLCAIRFE